MGLPIDMAISQAIQANAKSLPEYAQYVNYTERMKTATLNKELAGINLTAAQTSAQYANAAQSLATADYTKTGKTAMRYEYKEDAVTGDKIIFDKLN